MVCLIRHARIARDWDRVDEAAKAMMEAWATQPETRGVEAWGNIAGPQDEMRFVARFDSLAEEEKFALRLMADPGYEKAMMKFIAVFELKDDELVRVMD